MGHLTEDAWKTLVKCSTAFLFQKGGELNTGKVKSLLCVFRMLESKKIERIPLQAAILVANVPSLSNLLRWGGGGGRQETGDGCGGGEKNRGRGTPPWYI